MEAPIYNVSGEQAGFMKFVEMAKKAWPWRFRALLAVALSVAFSWYCFHGLAWVARRVGIIPIVNYEPAVKQWLLIGDPILQSWHEVSVTQDFTLAGYSLLFLTAVLAYYVGRVAYHLDLKRAFQRRDRWLVAGWLVGTPVIAVEGHFLVKMVSDLPLARQWPGFSGVVVGVVFLMSANLFGVLWGWVMRRNRVVREFPSR